MKIIELVAENVKRLKAVQITPGDESLVEITGRNGQGKTSVLDAIWWALGGTSGVQAQPIRQGENMAAVRLNLGDKIVERVFRQQEDGAYTTSLKVMSADGAKYGKPQQILDELVGALSFDPLAFQRARPDEQVAQLRALVKGFDFAAAERTIREAYDLRREVNRDIATLESRLTAMRESLPEYELPDEPVDVADLTNQMIVAQNSARERDQRLAHRRKLIEDRDNAQARIEDLQRQIEAMQGLVAELDRQAREIPEDGGEIIDPAPLAEKLRNAQQINEGVRLRKEIEETKVALQRGHEKVERCNAAMAEKREEIRAAIEAAQIPVEGLSLVEGGVYLDGVPFAQASDAQQLRASIAIAMAANPKLRVIRVRDGSLLDSAAIATLRQMATDADYQIWMERVDDSGEVGVVIEDGEVRGQHVEPVLTKVKEKAADKAEERPKEPLAEERKPMTAAERLAALSGKTGGLFDGM